MKTPSKFFYRKLITSFLLSVMIVFLINGESYGQPPKISTTLAKSQLESVRYTKLARTELQENFNAAKALEYAIIATDLDHENDRGYFLKARAEHRLGNNEVALKDYNKCIELWDEEFLYFVDRAQLFSELKRYPEAFNDYTKAIKLTKDPDDLDYIYLNRAQLKVEVLDWVGGLEDCNMALTYNSVNNSSSFALRGKIKYELQDYLSALNDCDKSIQISPGFDAVTYYTRGLIKIKLGKSESACADFNKASEIRKDFRIALAIQKHCQ